MFLFRNTAKSQIIKAISRVPLATEYIHATTTALKRPTISTPHPFCLTMAPLTAWKRLIRYVSAKDGSVKYGDPIVSDDKPDIDALVLKGGLKVKVLEGTNPLDAKPTGEEDEVKQLLGPLEPKDVPIVRCVGLNYRTHSKSKSISIKIPKPKPTHKRRKRNEERKKNKKKKKEEEKETQKEKHLTDNVSPPQSSKPASPSPSTQPSSSNPPPPSPTPAPPSPSRP